MSPDVRLLLDKRLLITDAAGGVAVLGPEGWIEIPAPLRDVVLKALAVDDDAA